MISEIYPHVEQNGILRSLFNKNVNYFEEDISIFASFSSNEHKKEFAFNFNQSNYWWHQNIGFCFKKGTALITKYEIQTSNQGCRPSIWSFSGSNNGKNWRYAETQNYNMSYNETYSVDWNHGVFRCYQLKGIKNQYDGYNTIDIKQIELFGTYFPKGFSLVCSLKTKKCTSMNGIIACIFLIA